MYDNMSAAEIELGGKGLKITLPFALRGLNLIKTNLFSFDLKAILKVKQHKKPNNDSDSS